MTLTLFKHAVTYSCCCGGGKLQFKLEKATYSNKCFSGHVACNLLVMLPTIYLQSFNTKFYAHFTMPGCILLTSGMVVAAIFVVAC